LRAIGIFPGCQDHTSKAENHLQFKLENKHKACGSSLGFVGKRSRSLALAAPILMAVAAWGQQASQAVWQGVLRNAGGAPIAAAKVRLADKSASAQAITSADGQFRLTGLPAGTYRLTIEADGRKIEYPQPIDLAPGVAPALIVFSGRGELTVGVLKAQTGTGGEELSSQAVSELPLNKRDFSTLLLLAAGTMTDSNGATNFTAQFAINGQRGVEATFAMDGADISDPEMGGATFSNFNVDAVEGIDSSSGWMPAEIGRGAAGFTNIRTRSGASGFHGSFFEFVRNSAFDARNFFDHPTEAYPGRIPPFRRNEFGFTNGGPVYIPHLYDGRKRTYYFLQYQGFRQVLGTTQVLPVPSMDQRVGIDTVTYPDGSTDTLTVPINPDIASILARYPKPNLLTGPYGANTYATASKVTTNADQFSLRLDHAFTGKDHFFARFTMDNLSGPTTNPNQTAIDPSFAVEYFDQQRNVVGTYTRDISPRLVLESSISIERSTPGFPTPNHTDPAVKFNDNLFEAFNSAGGGVMQAYGNLFQGRQNVVYTTAHHTIKAGVEARLLHDSTYWGQTPNGEFDFGGGATYYAGAQTIPSASGTHDLHSGDKLPDTLSAFLSGSALAYTIAIAPPGISGGDHIGPAADSRNNVNAYLQDTWKITPRLTLDYGVRWEVYGPITERAHRTSTFRSINGKPEYVVNPQPGYNTSWNGWGPRIAASWQVAGNLVAHLGGGITVIPPNLWQDNFLTGAAPFSDMPRLLSAANAPLKYGFKLTPQQLPTAYTPDGQDILHNGDTKAIAANTIMDVDRFEQELAALTPGGVVSDIAINGMDEHFGNGTLYTWTAGLERKFGNLTANASYVGTEAQKLPRIALPNAYPGADPAFAPWTRFDSFGNVIGGFGSVNLIAASAHSSYHALQTSLSGTVGHGGPGIQASYTWGKSIDDTSAVFGGGGTTGAVSLASPQNPYDTHPERGPSTFDVNHGFGLSVAQDLHLEDVDFLRPVSRKITDGWELLSISSMSTGLPFTIYSGIQQTGAGSGGVDRPDQIAEPQLSTARKNRQDYFGHGNNNATDFFSIPIHVAGGTGPNQGRFGTLGRNTFRGPAFYNFDFALIKDTPFGTRRSGAERMALQYRAEFFNLFNIVNMGLPANTLNGSGFGQISKTAGTSRQIQFSLKLIY
jgi:hypothetical protein